MSASRLNTRTILLLLAEAAVVFGAIILAVYLRVGIEGAQSELNENYGFLKAGLATVFCLTAFYLFDLYDFIVMYDRRELVLRLVQALGLAWIALALAYYALPTLRLGRGISLIALALAVTLMVSWRISIHWLMGHPGIGERILIVGSGNLAVD